MSRYAHGTANAICDRCGRKYKHNQLRKEWTGLLVCHGPRTNDCWEPRHPQQFVRGVPDYQAVHDPRPEPADTFVVDFLETEDGEAIRTEAGVPIVISYTDVEATL